jgi:hypothetical protein
VKLKLIRTECGKVCTIGALYVDGAFECFTLEDVVRADGVKVFGETAIPKGAYTVDITPSPRFKRDLPLLINVAGFVGVRIHPGNTAGDTEGCILVGQGKAPNSVTNSVKAFNALFPKLQAAKARGEAITLEIGS